MQYGTPPPSPTTYVSRGRTPPFANMSRTTPARSMPNYLLAGEEDSALAEAAPEERPNPFAALQGKIGSAGKREGE